MIFGWFVRLLVHGIKLGTAVERRGIIIHHVDKKQEQIGVFHIKNEF